MSRIFISYDRDDRPFVRDVVGKLRRVYDSVWFDENLFGGEDWWKAIQQKIADSDIFMFMLSEGSAQSPYCRKEHDEAIRLKKEILPVRIHPIQQIPDFLTSIQYVDMSNGEITPDNLTELNAAVNRLSDNVAQQLRQEQSRLLNLRRRSIYLRIVAGIVILFLLVLLGALALTQAPPFQGEIAYVSPAGIGPGLYILDGGVLGLVNKITQNNPVQVRGISLAEDSTFAWSPDGKRIAFASRKSRNSEIYLINSDGTGLEQLTTNQAEDRNPTWSPSGHQIAFASNRDGNWEIYQIDLTDKTETNLTNNPSDDDMPAWSPNGKLIAFASRRDGENWDIFRMNANGKDPQNLTNNPDDDDYPSWSPDSKHIVFESNGWSNASPPTLEPLNGNITGDDTTACTTTSTHDIFITDINGVEITWVVQNQDTDDRYPAWSPDGQYIIFSSNRRGSNDIYLVPAQSDQKNPILITRNDVEDETFPVWH